MWQKTSFTELRIILAPASSNISLLLNPQDTDMQSMPAFAAVAISTSESPIYTVRDLSEFNSRITLSTESGEGFFFMFSLSPIAIEKVS